MPKVDDIRQAAAEYGQESVENDRFCRQFKDDFIPVLREYLKPGDNRVVVGVPPAGDWDPEAGDYREVKSLIRSMTQY